MNDSTKTLLAGLAISEHFRLFSHIIASESSFLQASDSHFIMSLCLTPGACSQAYNRALGKADALAMVNCLIVFHLGAGYTKHNPRHFASSILWLLSSEHYWGPWSVSFQAPE